MCKLGNVLKVAVGIGAVAGAAVVIAKAAIENEELKEKYNKFVKECKDYADVHIPKSLNDERVVDAVDAATTAVASAAVTVSKEAHHLVDKVITDDVKEDISKLKQIGEDAISKVVSKYEEEVKAKEESDKLGDDAFR